MADGESFESLQKLYFTLDTNFNMLFQACKTDEQQTQLRTSYVNARDNFWEARNRAFQENDPLVKNLVSDLASAQKQIEESVTKLQNVAEVLKIISAAVHLGSSLITLGSAV